MVVVEVVVVYMFEVVKTGFKPVFETTSWGKSSWTEQSTQDPLWILLRCNFKVSPVGDRTLICPQRAQGLTLARPFPEHRGLCLAKVRHGEMSRNRESSQGGTRENNGQG